jgi:UDP:flavonoid glycosyltransferase YjiC (YdhE family)
VLPLQLGVGPAPIPLPDLTAERLLTALHQLVEQQDRYSAAAAKVAGELRNEDGLAAAVASVARMLSSAAQKPVANN